jgi:hypothetical protein
VESSGLGPCRLISPLPLPPLSLRTITFEAAREGAEAMATAGSAIPAERIDPSAVMVAAVSIPAMAGADPSTMGAGQTPSASEEGGQSFEASPKRGHPKVSGYVHPSSFEHYKLDAHRTNAQFYTAGWAFAPHRLRRGRG